MKGLCLFIHVCKQLVSGEGLVWAKLYGGHVSLLLSLKAKHHWINLLLDFGWSTKVISFCCASYPRAPLNHSLHGFHLHRTTVLHFAILASLSSDFTSRVLFLLNFLPCECFCLFLQCGFFKRKRIKDISGPMEEREPMAQTKWAWLAWRQSKDQMWRHLTHRDVRCMNWTLSF